MTDDLTTALRRSLEQTLDELKKLGYSPIPVQK